MLNSRLLFLPAALILGTSTPALAEWRCDCTTVLDSCSADVTVRGNWVDIETDHQQCARVDYFIDGIPFVAMVVEGEDRQNWLSRVEQPQVFVQSCQVCQDNSTTQPAQGQPTTSADVADGGLEPLIRVAPRYPANASTQGVEGSVTLEFTVNSFGTVEGARVVESDPVGVFDASAIAAVQRWRYSSDTEREAMAVTERLEFNLSDVVWEITGDVVGAPATAAPRNDCVRENITYDYGEVEEVGLINTCTEPLMVFGCALGTAEHDGLWVCIDSERLQTLLLRPGDGRVGSSTLVNIDTGSRTFDYGESIFVTRAPNTQYWWIACQGADTQCRDSARQWTRSVDRQLANVNPQGRASVAVSRSQ